MDTVGHINPNEIFDLIGGTSTGGLIATMLGRLHEDLIKAIRLRAPDIKRKLDHQKTSERSRKPSCLNSSSEENEPSPQSWDLLLDSTSTTADLEASRPNSAEAKFIGEIILNSEGGANVFNNDTHPVSKQLAVNLLTPSSLNGDIETTGVPDFFDSEQSTAHSNDYAPNVGSGSSGTGKIAIISMAGRFPDAAGHEIFWELLEKGLDVHKEVPKERFQVEEPISHPPFGSWIENPGLFDPRLFNMSPQEASQTDPMQRLTLESISRGVWLLWTDWREINAAQDADTYVITGGVRAFGPGRINYHFGFSGSSFNIDTACSSSALALQLACTSLWCEHPGQSCWKMGGQHTFTRAADFERHCNNAHNGSTTTNILCDCQKCRGLEDLEMSEGSKLPIDKKTHWRSTQHEGRAERRTSPKWWRCPKCLNQELHLNLDQHSNPTNTTKPESELSSLFDLRISIRILMTLSLEAIASQHLQGTSAKQQSCLSCGREVVHDAAITANCPTLEIYLGQELSQYGVSRIEKPSSSCTYTNCLIG